MHLIYSNRESKTDVDVDSVSLTNLLDGEEYRPVLAPYNSNVVSAFPSVVNNETVRETMLKLRTRDKYVVV